MGRLVLHLLHIKIKFACRQSPSQTGHETGRELAGWQTDRVGDRAATGESARPGVIQEYGDSDADDECQ